MTKLITMNYSWYNELSRSLGKRQTKVKKETRKLADLDFP